ncbi:hypothetical protein BH11PLA2_BH11PLA2_02050 [soil metagenome]
MRKLLSAAVLTGAVSFGWADEPKKTEDPKATKKADDKDEKKELTMAEKVAEMKKDINKESSVLGKKFQEAKTDDDKEKIRDEFKVIQSKYAAKMLDLAKADPKDAAAFGTVMSALGMGDDKVSGAAADFLLEKFADNPKLAAAIPQLASTDAGQKTLEKLAEKSKDKEFKGTALFTIAEAEINNTDYPKNGKPLPAAEAAKKMAAATKKLESIVKEYGDVSVPGGRGGKTTIAEKAKKIEFFVNNLVVGKKAPDMECELLEDGKKAKLSDYKGKVVVVDFWATWCPPCRAMIPHERELTSKLKDKPFAFISVSGDDKKETVSEFIEKEPMPWTHFWSGPSGTAVKDYQIRFWPTIYVLDTKGVIRYKHVREKKMDEAIETLLKEAESAKGGQ